MQPVLGGLLLATAHLCAETPLHVACHPTIGQGPCRRYFSVMPQLSSTQNRSPDPCREPEVRLHPRIVTTRLGEARQPTATTQALPTSLRVLSEWPCARVHGQSCGPPCRRRRAACYEPCQDGREGHHLPVTRSGPRRAGTPSASSRSAWRAAAGSWTACWQLAGEPCLQGHTACKDNAGACRPDSAARDFKA